MKKSISLLITFVCLCLFVSVLDGYAQADDELNIVIDPRTELLAIIMYLSPEQPTMHQLVNRQSRYSYHNDADEWFSDYIDHPAVSYLFEIQKAGFAYDAPQKVMLHVSPPPALTIELPFCNYLINRAGWATKANGEEVLEELLEHLRTFARETDFVDFYNQQQDFYEATIAEVRKVIGQEKRILTEYFGMVRDNFTVILSPLLRGAYSPSLGLEDGHLEAFCITGPSQITPEGLPDFGERNFRYNIWHRFGHTFINPTTALFRDEINKYAELFNPISSQMSNMAYDSWEACVNQHLIRAMKSRIACLEYGQSDGKIALQYELDRGFIYIKPLYEGLKLFENNRDKYPTFVDFYPEIIKIFANIYTEEFGK